MKYKNTVNVRWHETNAIREMSPSSLLALMQETANRQIIEKFDSPEDFRDKYHKAFILSKILIRFNEPIIPFLDVDVFTWTNNESYGYSFLRSFSVEQNGKTLAEAQSLWALVDTQNGTLTKVNEMPVSFDGEDSLPIILPRHIIKDESELKEVGKKKIMFSDIDYNRHMNNTHYPNMMFDYLDFPELYRAKEMFISFIKGSMYGEEITIYRTDEKDGVFYFRTKNEKNEICLDAYIKVEKTNKIIT